mgnify:CR=1 FL=1
MFPFSFLGGGGGILGIFFKISGAILMKISSQRGSFALHIHTNQMYMSVQHLGVGWWLCLTTNVEWITSECVKMSKPLPCGPYGCKICTWPFLTKFEVLLVMVVPRNTEEQTRKQTRPLIYSIVTPTSLSIGELTTNSNAREAEILIIFLHLWVHMILGPVKPHPCGCKYREKRRPF